MTNYYKIDQLRTIHIHCSTHHAVGEDLGAVELRVSSQDLQDSAVQWLARTEMNLKAVEVLIQDDAITVLLTM